MIILLLLLAASANQLIVSDETVNVPAGDFQGVAVRLQQRQAVLQVSYAVVGGGGDISVVLIGPGDGAAAAKGTKDQYLRLLPPQGKGTFRFPAAERGEYQVILDNRGEETEPVDVRLVVSLEFDEAANGLPATASATRQAVVIGLSTLFFLTVGLYSGRRLIAAVRNRPPASPPPPPPPLF